MKIHNVEQGSGEWKALRLGIPTASEMDALVTPEFAPRKGKSPETYLYQKLCERILGFAPDFSAFAVEQGAIMETEARPYYDMVHAPVMKIGFITTDDGRIGCSPDGLVGEDGGLEIKCPQPHTHLRYLIEGVVPSDYIAQIHTSLLVTGRKWWDFLSWSRQFDPLLLRVHRDELIIAKLQAAIRPFLVNFDAIYARIKTKRDADAAIAAADYEKKITKMQLQHGGELAGEKWLREKEAREAKP